MRAIPAPELALWTDGDTSVRQLRVRVRRPGDPSWTNLSDTLGGDWVLGVRSEGESPDQPAGRFNVQFLKHATEGSISPGISASTLNLDASLAFRPLVHPGRSIEVDVRIDAEGWRLWLQGEIEDVEWGGTEVVATCLTLDGVILATQIEAVEEAGAAEPGTPVEDEIQRLLDRWMAAPPTLLTAGVPDWNILNGTSYPLGSLGEQLRLLAQRNGWDIRYRWSEADGNFRLTLYLPPRDKVVADFPLPITLMQEVSGLRISRQWVRNAFPIRYNDTATAQMESEEVTDDESIEEYGRRAMPIDELADDSPIRSSAQALALGEYAKSDLSTPLADGRYRIPFLPWLELHDLLALQADNDRYDYDTDFAVVGISHVVEPEGGWWTEVELRGGKPAGAFYSWHARPKPVPSVSVYELQNFREVAASAPGKRRWEWDARGASVDSVWWSYDVFPAPWADDYWTEIADSVVPLADDQNWVEVDEPGADEVGALQVEPRLADGTIHNAEVVERVQVYPIPPKTNGWVDAVYENEEVNVSVGCDPTASALPVEVLVYEDGQSGTLLATHTFTAAGIIAPSDYAALGGRALAPAGKRTWWAQFTDRAGNVSWISDTVDNLAPNPNGWVDARYEAGVVNVYAGCNPTAYAFPIDVEVREDSQVGTVLATHTFSAAGQIGPADDADLGNRLPLATGKRAWWAKFTDPAGAVSWVSDVVESAAKPSISKLRQQVGTAVHLTDVFVTVESPVGRPISLRAWLNKSGTDDANPSSSVSGTYALTFTPGTPGSTQIGPADAGWSTATALLDDIAVWPGRGKWIHFEAIDDLGFTSGVQSFQLRSWLDIVGVDGLLIQDAIDRPAAFAASIRPLRRVATLPASGTYTGDRVAAEDTGLAWEWDGASWDALISGPGGFSYLPFVVADSISTRELSSFAVTAAKLNVASVFVSGMTLTNNSPGAGSVAWSACQVVFEGASHTVAGGNTALDVIWWDRTNPTVFQATAATGLVAAGYDQTDGDAIIALNESGTAREVWNGTLIYGGQIVTDAIRARHMAAITMEVGKYIQSSNYVAGPGGAGWKLEDDTAEFIDVTVRGQLASATGTFTGDVLIEVDGSNTIAFVDGGTEKGVIQGYSGGGGHGVNFELNGSLVFKLDYDTVNGSGAFFYEKLKVVNDGIEITAGEFWHRGSSVGFYNTAPISKPTGVAVTAAGIHAALVSLGLIAP